VAGISPSATASPLIGRCFTAERKNKEKNPLSGLIPWNADKSIASTLAFVVFGSIAGWARWWVRPSIVPVPRVVTVAAPLARRCSRPSSDTPGAAGRQRVGAGDGRGGSVDA
jgi:hypothetical protein